MLLEELGLLKRAMKNGLIFANPYLYHSDHNLSDTSNLSRKWQAQLKTWIADVLLDAPAVDWEDRLSAIGIPCSVQRSTRDWLANSAIQEAGIVTKLTDPILGAMLQPGPQVWLSDTSTETAPPQARQARRSTPIAWQQQFPRKHTPSDTEVRECSRPLEGITIIEMCSMVAGPVATRTIAEYGARVIKVDAPVPNHGPRMTAWYGIDVNQGKESILLDLKTDAGNRVIKTLLGDADILLTNHKPAAMLTLGLSEEDVRAINPNILYCSLSAYGGPNSGPGSERPGYDPVLQAASGIMMRYGSADSPELHAVASCVDALTGYSSAFGMALGLYKRSQDGAGCKIGTSLAAAATLVQLPFAFDYPGRVFSESGGQLSKGANAFNRLYQVKTGWVFLAANEACVADLPPSLQLNNRTFKDNELAHEIQKRLLAQPIEEVITLFKDVGMDAIAVRDIESLIPDLLKASESSTMRLIRRDVPGVGPVISAPPLQTIWNGSGLGLLPPAEKPGSSTDRILTELNFHAESLIRKGVAARQLSIDYLPS